MRPGGSRPRRADVMVAVVCTIAVVSLFLSLPLLLETEPAVADVVPGPGDLAWWAVLLTLLFQSAVLVWRQVRPEVVCVLAAVVVPVGAAFRMGPAIGLTSFALLVAVYSLATVRASRRIWPLLAGIGVLVLSGHFLAALDVEESVAEAMLLAGLQAAVVVGAPVVVAVVLVSRRESHAAREDRVQALEREQVALVQAAVARERTAMARELHDIAAHHLSGIAVMSAAVAAQIDTDPAGAKRAVADVRRESTAVLRDLRNLVGLLRDHDATNEIDDVIRVESLAGVPGLVSEVAAAGQQVALTTFVSAEQRPLGTGIGPLAQLAVYRTVQESLANAQRHAAGARCAVEIDDRDAAALVVEVRNARGSRAPDPSIRGGLGLVGMQERAELTGSHLDVGPTPEGGWQVRLQTPRAELEASG